MLHVLGDAVAAALVLSFQETLSALVLLLGQLLGKGAHALWSHIVLVEIKAQRGRCRRLWVHVDQVVDGGLHLGGLILRNLGARG